MHSMELLPWVVSCVNALLLHTNAYSAALRAPSSSWQHQCQRSQSLLKRSCCSSRQVLGIRLACIRSAG